MKMKRAALCLCVLLLFASSVFSQRSNDGAPLAVDSGYVQVDGGRLFYEIAGQGDYIVLLHDGILHSAVWDAQFPVLAKRYRVVRYDRRGFGKSSAPQAPFSHIDDLNRLFTDLKIDKAILFGMSAGGGIALDYTLKYPEKVRALVLVGAVVTGYGYSTHFLTRGGHISSIDEYLKPGKFIRYFGWEDPYEIYPENTTAKERFYGLLKANPQNLIGASAQFVKPAERLSYKFLSEIKVRTLVLVGEFDIPDVHAHAGVIEAGIPHAKREIISKSGHLIPLEQPEAFNATVLKFLDGGEFFDVLNSKGVGDAVQYFRQKREADPSITLFDEREMNSVGYRFLQSGKIKEAIELFRLNTIAYPDSWNVYDSLGEAYLKDGQKELALKNYEESVRRNPGNTAAQQIIKELKATK
jgi:3-oxoadipate enol-lactonase